MICTAPKTEDTLYPYTNNTCMHSNLSVTEKDTDNKHILVESMPMVATVFMHLGLINSVQVST